MNKIRGVNLGGWLVLERWMTPELFAQSEALDEYHLLLDLGETKHEIIDNHRDTFISEEDFKWMSAYGLNTVRLPVGYWVFQDVYPYIKSIDYVKKAFTWSEKYGLKVLLDVHAAPGCQNGFDNGGLSGICDWPKGDNIEKTLRFIETLVVAFKGESSLLGIEVLNEPRWDIDLNLIQQFYKDSYNIIRRHLSDDYVVVFHDAFRLEQWRSFFKDNHFENVILDTHMYQVFSHQDSLRHPIEVIEKTSILRYEELKAIDFIDVVAGEWSLGIHQNALSQLQDSFQKEVMYRAVGNSLLMNFENKRGWFFWNYKLSPKSTRHYKGWSFRDCVAKGYLPKEIKGEKI